MVNTVKKGREKEKLALELIREWFDSLNTSTHDMDYLDGGLAPKTARAFGKIYSSQNNDIFRAWDGWLLYNVYDSIEPTLVLFQSRSRYQLKDLNYLKTRKPKCSIGYLIVYNKPPKKLENIITTLPYGGTIVKMWAIKV